MGCYIKARYDKHDKDKIISFRFAVPIGKDDNGKPLYHWETMKTDSIRLVNKRIRDIQSDHDKGVYIKPTKLTVGEYLRSWIKDYCNPNLSPDTAETYRYMCETHIIPTLGNKPLTSLKAQNIQKLESEKKLNGRCDGKGGLSNRSVKYIHSTLSKSLNMAVKSGLILHNPIQGVDAPKVKRHEFKTLNEDDVNRVLDILKDSEYFALFFTDLFSGLRRGELLALRWKDIDLLGMTASVNRTIKCINKEIIYRPPKTEKSRRLVDLTPANVVILREHRAKVDAKRKSFGVDSKTGKDLFPPTTDEDLVFSHYDGKPYLPDTITHVWMTLVRKNGLTGIRFHDIRHSHASILFKQNVPAKIVQERLGHSRYGTTMDIYSHVAPGLQAAIAANFDIILKKKESKLEGELQELIQK